MQWASSFRHHQRSEGAKLTRISLLESPFWTKEGLTMPEQFENPELTKVEDETVSDLTAQKHIERVAEKAAEKASHTEQDFDGGHPIISK
jgi:hypothetical protein